MKKHLILALSIASLAGCSTIVKNPDDVAAPVAAVEPAQTDAIQASAAAPAAKADARALLENASRELRFDSGSAELKPSAVSALQELASALAAENAKVTIGGFADSSGSEKINQPLSIQRAKAVSSILSSHGLTSDRISLKGYSSKKPVASNDSAEGRAANRRAEISLQ